MCVCVYCYSVWVFSKSTVVKSFIILLPTAVIIETDCLVGPRLGGSKLGGPRLGGSKARWVQGLVVQGSVGPRLGGPTLGGSKAWWVQGSVGPRLGGPRLGGSKARWSKAWWSKAQWSKARWSKVNTYLHYLLPAWAHFNEAINTCVMFRKPR